jgi:hypothetical protein
MSYIGEQYYSWGSGRLKRSFQTSWFPRTEPAFAISNSWHTNIEAMSSHWTFSQRFGLPDFSVDRVQWNAGFERIMEVTGWADFFRDTARSLSVPDEQAARDELYDMQNRQRDLCVFQKRLTVQAARWFAQDDLESKWLGSGTSVRQEHLLEGIVQTCSLDCRTREHHRVMCDEVMLPYLLKDNGQGFLRLLRSVMIEGSSSVPSSPVFLPNSRFERMMGQGHSQLSEKEKDIQNDYILCRNEFICKIPPCF